LRDRKHKTKRRKSKQTRNKAEEENQIQQMTRNFKDEGTIASIPNDAPPLINKTDTTDHCLSCIAL
jgi:hypothetical protein